MSLEFRVARVETFVLRAPIAEPVLASFGRMTERPGLVLRVVAADGAEGWGEVWCNFPAVGARHRALLIETMLGPLLASRAFATPQEAFGLLTARTEVMALQAGEEGPIAQAIGGLDMAVWDMLARRAGAPLHRFLGGAACERVPAYASGLNPDAPETLALRKQAEGFRRFKLKVGFGRERDLRNMRAMREALGDDTPVMTDANQAWDFATARDMAAALAPFAPYWLEEPLRADRPLDEWRALAGASPIPFAAGENIRGEAAFAAMAESGVVRFLQPDIGKWGGFSGGLAVARRALAQGVALCPHWLGGAIGLAASLHFLAAAGGPGVLEVDSNDNPLREALLDRPLAIADGAMLLPEGPGLGVAPDAGALAAYGARM